MPWENPWAYDEGRKRIRESKDRETIVIEEKKEDFEKTKEKIRSRKKLDVFALKNKLETGNSLSSLKSDIKEALDRGDISVETYQNVITELDKEKKNILIPHAIPEYTLDPKIFPFADHPFTKYFESQKLGQNPFIDLAGLAYGFAQGSLFLLYLAGRIVLDLLLLPIDLYKMIQNK